MGYAPFLVSIFFGLLTIIIPLKYGLTLFIGLQVIDVFPILEGVYISPLNIIGCCLAIKCLLDMAVRKEPLKVIQFRPMFLIFLLIFFVTISQIYSLKFTNQGIITGIKQIVLLSILCLTTIQILSLTQQYRSIIWGMLIFNILICAWWIINAQLIELIKGNVERDPTGGYNLNQIGHYFACLIVFWSYIWMTNSTELPKLAKPLIPLTIICLISTLSRAAILSTLAPLFLGPFLLGKKQSKIFLVVVVLLGLTIFVASQALFERFQESNENRINLYRNFIPFIKDHWFLGVGYEGYRNIAPKYGIFNPYNIKKNALSLHNGYLQMWAYYGIFPFVIWICLHLAVILKPLKKIRIKNGSNTLTFCSIGVLLAYLLGCLTHDFHDHKLLWVFIGILLSFQVKNSGSDCTN